ncbi:hypothetical protein SAMN05445850_8028 [Paraburkholderia tuberum]|uniref:Uncharacterized protein n=2 Tax=Burkholderiaceae TaxID=119060 RepID=A0A1H1KHS9_9BURK|nr:hypothetical protein SAMN05445850_8028 [Paraburkholderia tuberum]
MFGAEFARVKESRVEFKAKDQVESIAAAYGKVPKVVKIYTARVRRWLARNFYYTHKRVSKRARSPDGRGQNDAWISESDARIRSFASECPAATESDLEHCGYFLAEVHVSHYQLERVLEVMLKLDKVLARMDSEDDPNRMDKMLAVVTEPLGWLRVEHTSEPLTINGVHKPSPFIRGAPKDGLKGVAEEAFGRSADFREGERSFR